MSDPPPFWQVYRTFIVWGRSYWVALLPFLLFIGDFGMFTARYSHPPPPVLIAYSGGRHGCRRSLHSARRTILHSRGSHEANPIFLRTYAQCERHLHQCVFNAVLSRHLKTADVSVPVLIAARIWTIQRETAPARFLSSQGSGYSNSLTRVATMLIESCEHLFLISFIQATLFGDA